MAHAAVRALAPATLRALRVMHEPVAVEGLLANLAATSDTDLRSGILTALCRLHSKQAEWDGRWWGTRPDTSGPVFKAADWEMTPRIVEALKKKPASAEGATLRELIADIQRHRLPLDEAVAPALRLAAQDASFRPVAVDLLISRGVLSTEAVALLEASVASRTDEGSRCVRALGALGRSAKNLAALEAAVRVLASLEKPPVELIQAREEFVRDGRQAANVAFFARLADDAAAPRRELAFAVLNSLAHRKGAPKEAREAAAKALEAAWPGPHVASILRGVALAKSEGYAMAVRAHLADGRAEVRTAAQAAAKALNLDKSDSVRVPVESLPYEEVVKQVLAVKGDPKTGGDLICAAGMRLLPHGRGQGSAQGSVPGRRRRALRPDGAPRVDPQAGREDRPRLRKPLVRDEGGGPLRRLRRA